MRVIESTFVGNVLKMSSVPLCTQILAVILMPIITRFYTPDSYGVFNLVGSIVMPISAFVTMGYSSAIILPKKDEEASNILFISLGLTVIISILIIPSVWFGSELLLRYLKTPELGIYVWFIPLNVFAIGLYLSFLSWNVRNRCFGRIAISRIVNAVVEKSVLIGAGFLGFASAAFLIIAAIAGSVMMSGVLGGSLWRESGQLFKQTIRWSNIIQGINRYRKFPIYNTFSEFFMRLADSFKIYLFSFYFSKSVIGYYGLGLAVLSVPMIFIGSSIGEVFSEKAARAIHEGTMAPLVEKLFTLMTWIGLLPLFLLAIIGENVFAIVFGANWSEAGVYAQILSFKMFFNFIMSPFLNLSSLIEKQELRLIFYIVTSIIGIASLIVGGYFGNVYIALCLISILDGLTFIIFGLAMFYFLKVPLSRIFNELLKCFLFNVPIIILISLMKWYFRTSSHILIIISSISCIVYYGILLKEHDILQPLLMIVLRKATSVEKNDTAGE